MKGIHLVDWRREADRQRGGGLEKSELNDGDRSVGPKK